jgi:activating signal cointegrator 1
MQHTEKTLPPDVSRVLHDGKLKGLSVRQPYAALIAQGSKTIEVRSWNTSYRGDVLICSGKKLHESVSRELRWNSREIPGVKSYEMKVKDRKDVLKYFHVTESLSETGVALCIATLYDVCSFRAAHENAALVDYSPGLFAWKLRNVRLLENTFPIKQKLSLFTLSDDVLSQCVILEDNIPF